MGFIVSKRVPLLGIKTKRIYNLWLYVSYGKDKIYLPFVKSPRKQTEPLSRAMFMPGENKEKTLTTLLVISVSYGWQMGLEPTTFRTTIVLEINIISIIVSQLSVSFIGQ